jgi:hypothetical protein
MAFAVLFAIVQTSLCILAAILVRLFIIGVSPEFQRHPQFLGAPPASAEFDKVDQVRHRKSIFSSRKLTKFAIDTQNLSAIISSIPGATRERLSSSR